MLMTGIFAKDVGLIYGETKTFLYHLLALVVVSIFTFGGSYLLYWLTDKAIPMRVVADSEELGLDLSQHNEVAARN
jgi:Amt family ammonium transporter